MEHLLSHYFITGAIVKRDFEGNLLKKLISKNEADLDAFEQKLEANRKKKERVADIKAHQPPTSTITHVDATAEDRLTGNISVDKIKKRDKKQTDLDRYIPRDLGGISQTLRRRGESEKEESKKE